MGLQAQEAQVRDRRSACSQGRLRRAQHPRQRHVRPGRTRPHPRATDPDRYREEPRERLHGAGELGDSDVPLSPPPPAGAEYFAANLTVRYTGGGSATARDAGTYSAIGSHTTSYNPFGNACPEVPQPPLDYSQPVLLGPVHERLHLLDDRVERRRRPRAVLRLGDARLSRHDLVRAALGSRVRTPRLSGHG